MFFVGTLQYELKLKPYFSVDEITHNITVGIKLV